MSRHFFLLIAATIACVSHAITVTSPDGNLSLDFSLTPEGVPAYSLQYKGRPVVTRSELGLTGKEADFTRGFTIESTDTALVDGSWQTVWGEYATIRDNYRELAVNLTADEPHRKLTLRFRLFDDGLGFRYELPEQPEVNYLQVLDELTQFNFSGDHTLYCIPGDYDTDEYLYAVTPISSLPEAMKPYDGVQSESQKIPGYNYVQTPLLVKTADSLYVSIHEAALTGYPVMSLRFDPATYGAVTHLTPDRLGVKAYTQLPLTTPWRTVIVSDDARDILSSQLILNLNEPCRISDTSWIRPMKFMGVWWEMFTGGSTWAYSDKHNAQPGVTDYSTLTPNHRHPANNANVRRYIDFASRHGFDGVLVEGWNQGWEDWSSYRKNRQFRFDLPYPDFDVDSLQNYAASKGIKLIMHHETSANAADYERQLEQAFTFMKQHGYDAVKTGYVGAIIPRSEHHTSQWMVDHVNYVAARAADYKIMVDSHEAPRPTGMCRTYPNWLAQESARGGEYESFGGNPPSHTCILPFTRLKGGPMDYTPGLFETRLATYGRGNTSQAGTTIARQLALYLTMPSPMQMACDLPENYERFPDAFQFIKDVPVDWANSIYIEAEPMRYITVARLDRNSPRWFVGAITDHNSRTAIIPLDFLPEGTEFTATIYADAPDAHYLTNPQAYQISTITVDRNSTISQPLAPGGGAAITLTPINR